MGSSNSHLRRRGRRDQAARDRLRPLVKSGRAVCGKCGQPIPADIPEDQWDAGHVTALGEGGSPLGPVQVEHTSCNRSHGAQLGQQLRRRPRRRVAEWLKFFGERPTKDTPARSVSPKSHQPFSIPPKPARFHVRSI